MRWSEQEILMMFLICLRHFLQEEGSKELSDWVSGQRPSGAWTWQVTAWTPLIILTNVPAMSSRNVLSSQSDTSNYIFPSLYFFLCPSEVTVWVKVLMWRRHCANGSNDRLLPQGGSYHCGRVHQHSAARHREKRSQQPSVWGTPAFVLVKRINGTKSCGVFFRWLRLGFSLQM